MNRPQLFTAAIALALAATAACDRAETSREAREAAAGVRTAAARAGDQIGDRLADGWLTAKVQAKFFADDDVKARYIDVTTRDGTVTLKGFVETDAIRHQALQIARSTQGVTKVEDRLLIGRAPQTASSGTPESGAVPTSGSSTTAAPVFDSRPLDDSMVISLIQARYFVEPTIKMRNIDVSAANGVVTLRGQVASDHERAQVLLLARTAQGVQRVEDGLTVDASLGHPEAGVSSERAPLPAAPIAEAPAAAPGTGPPTPRAGGTATGPGGVRPADTALESSVRAKLSGDSQLKAAGIDVSVRDGVVLLQGTVPNQATKQRALTMARESDGAVQVVDRLSVGRRR